MARRRRRSRSFFPRWKFSKLPFYPMAVISLLGTGGYLGCNSDAIPQWLQHQTATDVQQAEAQINESAIPARTEKTILVGSFNMKQFGPTKLKDKWVMQRFSEVIRCFDVIALQEVTSKEQNAVPKLLEWVNQNGAQYEFSISPRIGRTKNAEQYVFLWDTSRIHAGQKYTYVVTDESDLMHREPFVGRFQVATSQQPFRFLLINVHTDPDETMQELNALAFVYDSVRRYEYPEDDILLLGDLNARPGKLQGLERDPALVSLVNVPTNTRKDKTYDNVVINQYATTEFSGRSGILDLESAFGINQDAALRISDHLPIWAEFSIHENQRAGSVAAVPGASPGL